LRLDIWVFQKGAHVESKVAAACVAFLRDPFSGAKWMTTPDPNDDHFGVEFEPGPAVGMGLMVKKNENGEKIVEQWRTPIQLTKYHAPRNAVKAKTTNRRSKRADQSNAVCVRSNDWTSALVGSRSSVRPVQMSGTVQVSRTPELGVAAARCGCGRRRSAKAGATG
jgi:hypothetical protein